MLIVKIEGILAILTVISLRPKACKTLNTAKLAESGGFINIIRRINAFEAVVAGRTVCTSTLAFLTAVGRRIGIECQRTRSLTFFQIQKHRRLAFTAVSRIHTLNAMALAQLANHDRNVIKVVDGAVLIAGILSNHHEIGGIAREAGGGEVVPAG